MCVCLKTAALPEPCIIMSAVALTKWSPFLSFYLCVLSVIPLSHATTLNIYADMNTLSLCLTSGSRFLKTYILVFSIMENRSGLSLAHFISQTSLRSNLDGSPGVDPPSASPDEARVSTSKNVNTPVISIIASRLKKYICFKNKLSQHKQEKGVTNLTLILPICLELQLDKKGEEKRRERNQTWSYN